MKKLYLIIIMSLIACFIYAEPTPTVQWLMNEPATLFDIGILKLKILSLTKWKSSILTKIKRLKPPLGFRKITIGYNWDDNSIVISLSLRGSWDEKICKQVWNEWVNTIEPVRLFSQSERFHSGESLARYFNHIGFRNVNRPKDLIKNLSKIFLIEVDIWDSKLLVEEYVIRATGKIYDREPSIKKLNGDELPLFSFGL